MTDRGYWARLGLEGIEESPYDHPLGFYSGTIENTVLPRLAVLLQTLTTPEQLKAINALWTEMGLYWRQTNAVVEGLREMARSLKKLEDDVAYEAPDLQQLRDLYNKRAATHRFDEEAYKRSTIVSRDLAANRVRVDWDYQASMGRRLDRRLEEEEARKHQESAERHKIRVSEEKAKEEAELVARFGILYKTSPQGIDRSIPKNVRQDMAAAEQRLVAMGFETEVDGHVHCCTKAWGEFVVYGDPRSGNSLRFNVYKGSEALHTFWVKDKLGNIQEKLEAQLRQLDEQDRAAEGFLYCQGLAEVLQVSVHQIKRLVDQGMPVSVVGSHQRFDREKVLHWLKSQAKV